MNLGTSWRLVVSITLGPLYPWGKRQPSPLTFGSEARWLPESVWTIQRSENSWSYRGTNLDPSVGQPAASHYTEWHMSLIPGFGCKCFEFKCSACTTLKYLGNITFKRNILSLSFFFNYCIFTIYSRYIKRVISKRNGCEYLKQVPSIDGSLELIQWDPLATFCWAFFLFQVEWTGLWLVGCRFVQSDFCVSSHMFLWLLLHMVWVSRCVR
jgi:hypothetical protein